MLVIFKHTYDDGLFGIVFWRPKSAFEIIENNNYKYKENLKNIKCVLGEF